MTSLNVSIVFLVVLFTTLGIGLYSLYYKDESMPIPLLCACSLRRNPVKHHAQPRVELVDDYLRTSLLLPSHAL